MIGLSVDHGGMDRALLRLVTNLHEVARDGLVDAGLAAIDSARETISRTTTRRTGALEDRWHAGWLGPHARIVTNFAKHARFIESGTRGHYIPGGFIPSRGGKTLAFMWNGRLTFRKWVYHPGTKARPFQALALAAGQMAMRASLTTGTDRLARSF